MWLSLSFLQLFLIFSLFLVPHLLCLFFFAQETDELVAKEKFRDHSIQPYLKTLCRHLNFPPFPAPFLYRRKYYINMEERRMREICGASYITRLRVIFLRLHCSLFFLSHSICTLDDDGDGVGDKDKFLKRRGGCCTV